MAISFSPQQIKDITRRMLNIVQENAAYASTATALTAQQTTLLNVDNANAAFYNAAYSSASSYEQEGRALVGTVAAVYTNGTISPYTVGDLSASAAFPGVSTSIFYPGGTYGYLIPDPSAATPTFPTKPVINGFFSPTSTDVLYEGNTIIGISTLNAYYLLGSFASSSSTITAIPAGVVPNLVLADTTGSYSNGQLVTITNGSTSGVYVITATVPSTSITVSSVIPAILPMSGGTIDGSGTALQTSIHANITLWGTQLTSQQGALTSNTESRPAQITQNGTALSNVNAALAVVNTWLTTPDYTSTGLGLSSPIYTQLGDRPSSISARITQITTSLGLVTVSGNTYTDGGSVVGGPYFERYKWLNNRINIASGSARRYFAANQGSAMLETLQTNNTAIQGDYSAYFNTKRITQINTTPIVQVSDVTGLNAGDVVYVISESQPAIMRGIVSIMGTTQLQLDSPIPNVYQVNTTDIARLYKQLQ